jgi:outer membrane protein OmpA-like peptidoglycan-associated protein
MRLTATTPIAGPLELKPATASDEAVLAGASFVRKTYTHGGPTSSAPFLVTYRDGLFAAGWKVLDISRIGDTVDTAETIHLSAQYGEKGRNLYAKLTQPPDGPLFIDVADVGAEDWAATLARSCRLRLPSIHFALDAAAIDLAASEPTLRRLAQLLTTPASPTVTIEGHTDNIGEAASAARLALSEKRALAVVAWLTTTGGVAASKVTAEGIGRARPIADNDTDLGRALNRRIEVAARGCVPAR